MSNTKQCDCCDLFRDEYEVETVASGQPGVRFIVCEDCLDQCPNGSICDLSGKSMKPDVEAALVAHNGGPSNGHPGYSAGGWGPGGAPFGAASGGNVDTCDICGVTQHPNNFGLASGVLGGNVLWCDTCYNSCPPPKANGQTMIGRMPVTTSASPPYYMLRREQWAEFGFHPGVVTQGAPLNPPQPKQNNSVSQAQVQHSQQMVNKLITQMGGTLAGQAGQVPMPKEVHEIPEDAECQKHGGHWGDDATCDNCTDEDGDPKKYRKPKPPPKFLTKDTSGAHIDTELERLKLQLKFGLTDQGKPLTSVERADIQKVIDKYEVDTSEQDAINSITGTDDDEDERAAIASILGLS